MDYFRDGELNLVHVRNPNVYYCMTNDGGVICFYVQRQPFRAITYGKVDHNALINYIERLESANRESIPKRNSSSVSVGANVISDVSGLISSFYSINAPNQSVLRSLSRRTLSSVNAEIKRRVSPELRKVEHTIGERKVFYERTDKLHGELTLSYDNITYTAIFFEGKPLADMWFTTKEEQLLSTRCFNETEGFSIDVPRNIGIPEWFSYQYNIDNDNMVRIGTNECDLSLAKYPGERDSCGDFIIRIITKQQSSRENQDRVIKRYNFGTNALIIPVNMNGAWASTDNLNAAHSHIDEIRKKLCGIIYIESKKWKN